MASQKKRAVRTAPAPPPSGAGRSRRSHVLAVAALVALALLAYSNSFRDGNTLDNYQLLRLDKRIQQATSQNVSDILHHTYWWPYGESGLYRPLATLSYLFNYSILGEGEQTAGYHIINFLLHACNIVLVYLLALRLLGTRGRAFAVAALWSVHPVLTESVTNMVGRPDLLAGIGVLGGFLCYLVATESAGNRRRLALAGAAAATAVGVFSKESGVTVIGVIGLYEFVWWKERRKTTGRPAALTAVALPIAAMLLVRMQVMSGVSANFPFLDNPLVKADFVEARLTALAVLARYLWRLICPITLSADYSYDQIPLAAGTLADWISWTAIAGLVFLVFQLYRSNRTAFFLAGFAAVTFVPMSNLLFPIGTIMAERFLYLPAIAFCACLVLGWAALPARFRAAAPFAVGALAAAYAVRTWLRNPDWWNDTNMARALIKTSPDSFKVRRMLAFWSFRADPSHSNLDYVIANAEAGLAILNPLPNGDNDAEAYRFAGGYYLEKADMLRRNAQGNPVATPQSEQAYRRAGELFHRALSIKGKNNQDPNSLAASPPDTVAGDSYRLLSRIDLRLNDPQKAYDDAVRAVAVDPFDPEVYIQWGRVLIQANQLEGAARALMNGSTLTGDQRLSSELLNLFHSPLNSDGCALRQNGQAVSLNLQCPSVKRFFCPAVENGVLIRQRTGSPDLARDLLRLGRESGCATQ